MNTTGELRVAALTGGRRVPSARFRIRQFQSLLGREGIQLTELPATFCSYPPARRWLRPGWAALSLAERLVAVSRSWAFDVVIFQRELISGLFTFESLTRRPRILDVDDAIFLLRDGVSARRLAQSVDAVFCGNSFIAEWFSPWNRQVEVVPTAVDTHRFRPGPIPLSDRRPIVVWSGTSSNLGSLIQIEPALNRVFHELPDTRLRVVCDREPCFSRLDKSRVDFVPWSPASEVTALEDAYLGVMPLEDSDWSRGKCSLKMLTYLSCGLPSVASPVGSSQEILGDGGDALTAKDEDEWVSVLLRLLSDSDLAEKIGSRGRARVEREFSVEIVGLQLAKLLWEVTGLKGAAKSSCPDAGQGRYGCP